MSQKPKNFKKNGRRAHMPSTSTDNVSNHPARIPPAHLRSRINSPSSDDDLDRIFAKDIFVDETCCLTKFTPSAVALIEISRKVYFSLEGLEVHRKLLPEYLDYYHTFCFWARVVAIKRKTTGLTASERSLFQIVEQCEYSVAEPILKYLSGLGNITTSTGQHLYADFPKLPETLVGQKPGFYGPIDVNTHNLYEEIPCMGVLAEGVQHAVSDIESGSYASSLNLSNAPVNENLLGFHPLTNRLPEAKKVAIGYNITAKTFESTIGTTAINIPFINTISNILHYTNSSIINLCNLPIDGCLSQIISTTRECNQIGGSDVISKVRASSLTRERPYVFGAAISAAYQLEKSAPRANWMCVTPEPVTALEQAQLAIAANPAAADPFVTWDENRNIRRNLPEHFKTKCFTSSGDSIYFRENVLFYNDDHRINVCQINDSTKFTPSAVALIEISRNVYSRLRIDNSKLYKILLPEYLDYYHTFCFWARVVTIKRKNQKALTASEELLCEIVQQREYSVVEPIFKYISGIGNITTSIGHEFYPAFPDLPEQLVGQKPGFYGPIDVNTHNLCEEIPCMGVLAEGVQYAVSNIESGTYASSLNLPNAPVNENLLGFRPLHHRRPEAKNVALDCNITDETFKSTIGTTAINIPFINMISDILDKTNTFKINRINFWDLPINGCLSQMITTTRQGDHDLILGSDVTSGVRTSSLTRERPCVFGAAIYAAYQLEKSAPRANWMCVTPEPVTVLEQAQPTAADPFVTWDENRNTRRNLPEHYKTKCFTSFSQHSGVFRDNVIAFLAKRQMNS